MTGDQTLLQIRVESGHHYSNGENYIKSKDLVWELVYTGKENNMIKFLYREYYSYVGNSYIKSDYTVEYKYDLNEGKKIKFRNFEIEIINSNPSSLEYKILSE